MSPLAKLFFLPLCLFLILPSPAVFADATEDAAFDDDNLDRWEGFNRKVYDFNTGLDNAIAKPVARGYKKIIPDPLRRGVSNFFSNIGDVRNALNNFLQGKPHQGLSSVGRVVVNTTIGIGGIFDVATQMDIPRHSEDFGQTLGYWGVPEGPYIVLPFWGPSTVRDTAGLGVDLVTDPILLIDDDDVLYALAALYLVDRRTELLPATDLMEQMALDPYLFQREAYLQNRRYAVEDRAQDENYDF